MTSQLNPEDQARVDQYLDKPQRQHSYRASNLWWLLLGIWVVLFGMGGVSYWIASAHGVI